MRLSWCFSCIYSSADSSPALHSESLTAYALFLAMLFPLCLVLNTLEVVLSYPGLKEGTKDLQGGVKMLSTKITGTQYGRSQDLLKKINIFAIKFVTGISSECFQCINLNVTDQARTAAAVPPLFTGYENCYAVHVKRTHDGELLH